MKVAERDRSERFKSRRQRASTGVTPYARLAPTAPHVLFVGLGTSSFCDYWAKAFNAVVGLIGRHYPTTRSDASTLERVFKHALEPLRVVWRLATHYAEFGTLVGFGRVESPVEMLGYRLQLLRAMELFIVALEFCPFVADERFPNWSGSTDRTETVALELFCDELGFSISRTTPTGFTELRRFHGSEGGHIPEGHGTQCPIEEAPRP